MSLTRRSGPSCRPSWRLDVPVDDTDWSRLDLRTPPAHLEALKRLLLRRAMAAAARRPRRPALDRTETQALLDSLVESLPRPSCSWSIPRSISTAGAARPTTQLRLDPLPPRAPLRSCRRSWATAQPRTAHLAADCAYARQSLLWKRACGPWSRRRSWWHPGAIGWYNPSRDPVPATVQAVLAARIDAYRRRTNACSRPPP